MRKRVCAGFCTDFVFLGLILLWFLDGQDVWGDSKRYKAVRHPQVSASSTWKIMDRDGANRKVDPYLSSLGKGESGTGTIVSPVFKVSSPVIEFTICGHDGQSGGRKKNFISLVDAGTGKTLRRTYAPLSDPMQKRKWEVEGLKGRKVRIEIHDGDSHGAYAWLGAGMIEGGPGGKINFGKSIPGGWKTISKSPETQRRLLKGAVPFLSCTSPYTVVSLKETRTIPLGIKAKRLFFLGCTVPRGEPLEVFGYIEIACRNSGSVSYPLMVGYTLDLRGKLPSSSKAMHLQPVGPGFQRFLVIAPRDEVIKEIRLRMSPRKEIAPRITAITCETSASHKNLLPLPEGREDRKVDSWIESHAISEAFPDMEGIISQIRKDHRLPLKPVNFKRKRISRRNYEAASVCDVDGDGVKDIVSGAYWYKGPEFARSCKITEIKRVGEYWDDFLDYPMDVNGDGCVDIITGGWFGRSLRWVENPGDGGGEWKVHPIAEVGPIETARFWDVNGDGIVEAVPNAGGNVVFFRLVLDENGKGTGDFTKHVVKEGGCGHGLGFGDINGDGRGDFVVPNGWIEGPEDPLRGKWAWHDDGFRLGGASVPVIVHDVNGDGKADLIVGQGHGYGLDWYEQRLEKNGKRKWVKHLIEGGSSQYHDMLLSDIDNDGEKELITGKRYRAHNGHDPGAHDPLFIRYFDINRGDFLCHTVQYGPPESTSGVGIYFRVEDVDGNGWKDIVAPGKEGLYLFKNQGK